jgi:SNF2 family DNA or RNA helicase
MVPDVRQLSPLTRFRSGERVRTAASIEALGERWPDLPCWNDRPCAQHAAASGPCWRCGASGAHLCVLCDRCGIQLRKHQKIGGLWLYFANGLLADSVGTGKTATAGAMLALCRESGELGPHNRAVILCQPVAIDQWKRELARMMPSLRVVTAPGSDSYAKRVRTYSRPGWEVVILSDRTLSPARGRQRSRPGDIAALEQLPLGILIYDDVDAMRNRTTSAASSIRRLAARTPRIAALHGTPLQKRLKELYSFLEPLGGPRVLGTEWQFERRYTQSVQVVYYARDQFGQQVERTREQSAGIINEQELRRLIAPMTLRRRAQDLDDVTMPALVQNTVWLDPTPAQRRRYDELREGVLRRLQEEGEVLTHPQAVALFTHGWQICSGLATLDEGGDDSVKLDWLADHVAPGGDLSDDKVVAFINFKPNVAAMSRRLDEAGVGHEIIWGQESRAPERDRRLARFREDPSCRVLLGTTSIERSLNLQAARHLVAVDTLSNPARMTQIAGRVRRAGSLFPTVFFHQILLRGTQEEGIFTRLHSEQATADTLWQEQGELFQPRALGARELVGLITGRRAA